MRADQPLRSPDTLPSLTKSQLFDIQAEAISEALPGQQSRFLDKGNPVWGLPSSTRLSDRVGPRRGLLISHRLTQ